MQPVNAESAASRLSRLLGVYASDRYKKLVYVLLGLLVVYVVVRGVKGASVRPFWFDELCTVAIANQPTLGETWRAIALGFDGQPPGFDLLERAAGRLVHDQEVALRLPSILGFACTVVCVFAYAKKRSGELIALLCALSLLCTSLFHVYLVQARPYSLVVACIAFALVCYQRLPSRFWTVMLGFTLLLAGSLHYYAFFALVPFGVAELVLSIKTHRPRWPVWIALMAGTVPLMVFWPLLSKIRAYGAAHHVSLRTGLWGLPDFYGAYFLSSDVFGFALLMVSVAGIVWSRLWPGKKILPGSKSVGADAAEGALLLALNLLPLVVFVLIQAVHGGVIERYCDHNRSGAGTNVLTFDRSPRRRDDLCALYSVVRRNA